MTETVAEFEARVERPCSPNELFLLQQGLPPDHQPGPPAEVDRSQDALSPEMVFASAAASGA